MNPFRDDFVKLFDRAKIKEMTIDIAWLSDEYQCRRFAVMVAVMFHTKVRFEFNERILVADGRNLTSLMTEVKKAE